MTGEPLLEVRDLHVGYRDRRRGASRGARVPAVQGVSLEAARGEVLGIVGESGCGKSTLARALVGVTAAEAGVVRVGGRDLAELRRADPRAAARLVQVVFQDPAGAMDPRQRVGHALEEVRRVHGLAVDGGEGEAVAELLARVGLGADVAGRFPHQLSGGQRQRVGIARALAVVPEVLVLDEPVSALDVSVQAQILALLDELRRELRLTILFIAHDLAVVRAVCHRVTVLYRGRVVETGPADVLFDHPRHPYTRELLAAVPTLGESSNTPVAYERTSPGAGVDGSGGCPYLGRCGHPLRDRGCADSIPPLREVEPGRFVACSKES